MWDRNASGLELFPSWLSACALVANSFRNGATCAAHAGLHGLKLVVTIPGMWNQPYLETCCRSALHRLVLSGRIGRPPGLKDGACLARLAGMGLASVRADGRYSVTEAGSSRHAHEVLRHDRDPPAVTASAQLPPSAQSRSR